MIKPPQLLKNRLRMRHLRILQALFQEGSLRKTAECLAISQPAATKALRELEELVGKPLFLRSPQGLTPNELGKAAIRYAQLVFADLDSLYEEMLDLQSGYMGTIRIGAMSSIAGNLLPNALAQIKKNHPKLNVSVIITTSDILLQSLSRDQLDLVIARIPHGSVNEEFDFELFDEEIIQIVARNGHPEMSDRSVKLSALTQYPWIVHPQGTPLNEIFCQIFREARLKPPTNTVETASITLTASLLQKSDTITLMSYSLANFYRSLGLLSPLPVDFSCHLENYGLIRRKNRIITPVMQIVSDILRNQL